MKDQMTEKSQKISNEMNTFFKQTTDTIDKKQNTFNSQDSDRLI